jgi:NAD(P)-dependent dehydrogenase (short-subunit alcohol dehydrogenase family)
VTNALEAKTAIITGAGGGIGRKLALRFVREGSLVMLVGRTLASLDASAAAVRASGGEATVHVCDVSSATDCDGAVAEAMDEWGRIDILVNNAAIDDEATFLEMSEEGWDQVLDVNLKGPFLLSQRVARCMVAAGGGSILHISSIDHAAADGPYTSYNVSKTGLLSLSRCIAVELAPYNVRSNVVSPGATQTEMIERVMGAERMEYLTTRFERVPMRRMVLPEEVAAACVFLASDEASAITGVNLNVDCGTLANLFIMETLPDAVEPAPA